MPNRGRLFVISGPAGVGKSEIVKKVLERHPDVQLSVSCTTRQPRPGEIDGVSYHFVDDARFDRLVAEDAFYEWEDRINILNYLIDAIGDKLGT